MHKIFSIRKGFYRLGSKAKASAGRPAAVSAFTLIELLAACAVLGIVVVLLVLILGQVSDIWIVGRAKMNALQQGRAVLDFFARDMRSLEDPQIMVPSPGGWPSNASSPQPWPMSWLQFVQDAELNAYPVDAVAVGNSSNVFGQATGSQTSKGSLWILGYFLAEHSETKVRTLYRVSVPPDAGAALYKLYGTNADAGKNLPWLDIPAIFTDPKYAQPLAMHMAAFYVTCLDAAGHPIPWLSSPDTLNGNEAAYPLKFNSAARFIMPKGPSSLNGQKAFTYLPSGGLQAHQLPSALQVHFVAVDDSYVKRKQALPPAPALDDPAGFGTTGYEGPEVKAQKYIQTLYESGVLTARLFTVTVPLNTGL